MAIGKQATESSILSIAAKTQTQCYNRRTNIMARTVRTKVYKFDELSKESKKKAIEWAKNCLYEYGFNWANEAHDSVRLFCEELGIKLHSSYFSSYNSEVIFNTGKIEDDILELSGKRLMAYLWNNYSHLIIQKKQVWFVRNEDGSKTFNAVGLNSGKYVSKCQFEDASCPLTGYSMDDSLTQPLKDFVHGKNFSKSTTFKELIKECMNSWENDADADCQYQESDEQLSEHIVANEYEFTQDGKKY